MQFKQWAHENDIPIYVDSYDDAKLAWNACAQAIFEELDSRGLYGAHLALDFQDSSSLETPDDS